MVCTTVELLILEDRLKPSRTKKGSLEFGCGTVGALSLCNRSGV